MATIKLEIVAGGNTYTSTKTISGPDLTRLLTALRQKYNMNVALTDAQAAAFWQNEFFIELKALTKGTEQAAAAKTASDAIADVTLT